MVLELRVGDQKELGDSIPQAACRERTEYEDRAVDACMVFRVLRNAGAGEMRIDPD
jgi:hypothetical protein